MPDATALRRKMLSGTACLGAWLLTNSADVAEIMASAGMDFLLIDHEHGQGNIADAIAQLRAIRGTNCAGILRVPDHDPVYIKRVLDAGVDGILVPNVATADEARRIVGACRYPPLGWRGAFGGMRAMDYGFNPGYYAAAADKLLIAVQVESAGAIDNIAEIATVDGIDLIFIGPRDLSATLGKLNLFDDPDVQAEIARAEQAILSSGKLLGSTAINGRVAKEMAARGYRFIIPGSDVTLLGLGLRQTLAEAR
ncbi:HpcH/HpaI aldolase/citrate lyase family protein [Dongia sp.]|uniref:HpcH/HpaI aldolase family protein n=1 Tax=Dongia sp. TaxID=1977262 RepID=UPI0035AE6F56